MVNNLQAGGDGIHSADMERLKNMPNTDAEEFTLYWHPKEELLILKVNGVERNRLKASDAEGKFDMCLQWIKEQFISWRNPKN